MINVDFAAQSISTSTLYFALYSIEYGVSNSGTFCFGCLVFLSDSALKVCVFWAVERNALRLL